MFCKANKKESLIAILAGIIAAGTETIAIYYLSEIIRNLEYLRISEEITKSEIDLIRGLFIFLIFSIISSIIFLCPINI